jgi:hypothetical protein
MLFDLRGRGRRRAVKVIYLGLAVLLGGGLVFFGIGGNTSGGLFDAFKDDKSSAAELAQDRRDSAAKKTQATPQNATVWVALAETEYQLANQSKGLGQDPQTGATTYSGEAKSHLEAAKRAWERHLQLAGDKPDLERGAQIANVYLGLQDYAGAVKLQELVLENRGDNAGFGDYVRLATFAYQAGQTRKGDLASERAVELAPTKDQKDQIKQGLEAQKAQSAAATGQSTLPTPTPTTSTDGS